MSYAASRRRRPRRRHTLGVVTHPKLVCHKCRYVNVYPATKCKQGHGLRSLYSQKVPKRDDHKAWKALVRY